MTTKAQVTDIVCPICFKPLQYPSIAGQDKDRYHGELRTYYGWCFDCEKGSLVIQFKRDDRWVIHKYREAILLDGAGECELGEDWRVLNELPEPAPIVTGPGGDYDKQITPGLGDMEAAFCMLQKAMTVTSAAIGNWLKRRKVGNGGPESNPGD